MCLSGKDCEGCCKRVKEVVRKILWKWVWVWKTVRDVVRERVRVCVQESEWERMYIIKRERERERKECGSRSKMCKNERTFECIAINSRSLWWESKVNRDRCSHLVGVISMTATHCATESSSNTTKIVMQRMRQKSKNFASSSSLATRKRKLSFYLHVSLLFVNLWYVQWRMERGGLVNPPPASRRRRRRRLPWISWFQNIDTQVFGVWKRMETIFRWRRRHCRWHSLLASISENKFDGFSISTLTGWSGPVGLLRPPRADLVEKSFLTICWFCGSDVRDDATFAAADVL